MDNRKKISSIIYRILAILFIFGSIFLGINYINNYLIDPQFTQLVQWYVILIILNLIVMIFIFYSYSKIKNKQGLPGPPGYTGASGKPGQISTCAVCEKDIPIMEQKYDSVILQEPILDEIDTDPSGTIVKIWDRPNRQGVLEYLKFGNYRKLSNRFKNSLRTLEIKDGYMITIYSEENYKGFKETFPSGYYPDIKDNSSMINLARSLKIEKAKDIQTSVTVWGQIERRGLGIDLIEGKYPNLDKTIDNKVNSIKIPIGYIVILYQSPNFKGRKIALFEGYHPKINGLVTGFSSNIRSIIVRKGNPIEKAKVKLWEHPYRQGRKIEYDIGWYEWIGREMNDHVTCIEVPKGYRVTVYKHSNFNGSQKTYKSGYYPDIRNIPDGLNDAISSVIVEYDI